MLPTYTATSIIEAPMKGGSTQPCLVVASAYNGVPIGQYVVKIFKRRNIEQINGTAKEVYANVLARHFDLKVPTAALIEVGQWLIDDLKSREAYRNWDITEGVYFGTRYITGGIDFTEDVKHKVTIWEKENIFAFDALIRNVDRTHRKKNLFLAADTVYLIDHELSLDIQRSFNDYMRSNDWVFLIKNPKGDRHLFFNDLTTYNKKDTLNFDEFAENLRTLKPQLLIAEAEQLFEYGISVDDFPPIGKYLTSASQNTSIFINSLKNLLS